MANLKEIRSRIKSVKNIQKVTKAMKMVAAAKLRKSQENMELARPYAKRLKRNLIDLQHGRLEDKYGWTTEVVSSLTPH